MIKTLLPAALLPVLALAGPPESGQKLFNTHCVRCHGKNGKAGLNGAHDLTKSNLNPMGRTYLITNGMGKMPAFREKMSAVEIQRVAAYSLTLK